MAPAVWVGAILPEWLVNIGGKGARHSGNARLVPNSINTMTYLMDAGHANSERAILGREDSHAEDEPFFH